MFVAKLLYGLGVSVSDLRDPAQLECTVYVGQVQLVGAVLVSPSIQLFALVLQERAVSDDQAADHDEAANRLHECCADLVPGLQFLVGVEPMAWMLGKKPRSPPEHK